MTDHYKSVYQCLSKLHIELDNIVRALNVEYIQPVKAGVPEEQGLDMMPTGRNFFIFDSKKIPTQTAYKKGQALAEHILAVHKETEGHYPEKIALNMISTDISQASGEMLSQILYLIGVEPVWNTYEQVIGLKVIPLERLGRPRIDITLRISGVLRDTYPDVIEWIDQGIQMVHDLDEAFEDNFLLKHTKEMNSNDRYAQLRIFGDKPGAYGAGVDLAIKASAWKSKDDLATVFVQHSAYAYGKDVHGENRPYEFIENIKKIDASYDVSNAGRYDMLGSSFGTSVNGGYYLLAKHFGKNIKQYAGHKEEKAVEITSLDEAVTKKLSRTFFRDGWKEHLMTLDYEGTMMLLKHIQNVVDWKIVKDNIDDHVLDDIVMMYISDEQIKAWMLENNPYALEEMARRMLELKQRALYQPDDDVLKKLTMTYLEFEGELENSMGAYDSELQGSSIDIIISDDIVLWKKELDGIKKIMSKGGINE